MDSEYYHITTNSLQQSLSYKKTAVKTVSFNLPRSKTSNSKQPEISILTTVMSEL